MDPELLQRNHINLEVISSKFDLIGYACFSPLELLGVDFYRFQFEKEAKYAETPSPCPCHPVAKSNGRARIQSPRIL